MRLIQEDFLSLVDMSSLQKRGFFSDDDDKGDDEDEYLVSGTLELNLDQRYARERLREIRKIAKSIQDIKMMFIEISDMVVTQGTVLDRIDQNLVQADLHIAEGVVNLVETKTHESQSAKCWLVFLAVVVVFSIIIVIVIRNKRLG